ncbi:MAG: toxin-antitoxin system YwqK family antitoxin [Pirellulales bacterium]
MAFVRSTLLTGLIAGGLLCAGCGEDSTETKVGLPEADPASSGADNSDANAEANSTGSRPTQVARPSGSELPPREFTGMETREDRFTNGELRRSRRVKLYSDGSVVNHDEFAEYFPDGKVFMKGQYKDGIKDGKWEYYYDNGELRRAVMYANGRLNGSWDVFREDGTKEATHSYKDHQRDGTWIAYDESGEQPLRQQSYSQGTPHGDWISWFPSGQKRVEGTYEMGRRDGVFTRWNEDGMKVRESAFADGQPHGRSATWDRSGNLLAEREFRDGKMVSGTQEIGTTGEDSFQENEITGGP